MSKNPRELSDTEQGVMNRALRASVAVVSKELMPLNELMRLRVLVLASGESGVAIIDAAIAAQRLQEEVGRLKAREYLNVLKALKLAEEALRFYADECNWIAPSSGFSAQYDPEPSPIQRDDRRMLVEALAAIDALGKEGQSNE